MRQPKTFKAIVLEKQDGAFSCDLKNLTMNDLPDDDVTIAVRYSSLNYKDGLALTNRSPVVRQWPMVPGIDFAGEVVASHVPGFAPGDVVVATGWGMGETHWGGYSEYMRVPGTFLTSLPSGLELKDAMIVGTAGLTAMLCVLHLERAGVTPGVGDVLVTGAAGGVGSVAIMLLAAKGHRVVASTGRAQERDYLKRLGASEIIDRAELSGEGRPLAKERWAGAVDTVGSRTLANVLSSTVYGGTVACCGLAQGPDLPASVMPFILRGVRLQGVDSVMAPQAMRQEAWFRLASDLDLNLLRSLSETIELDDVPAAGERILAGKIRGRVAVRINGTD